MHLLDSLVVFADVADTVSAEPAATLGLRVAGAHGATLAAEPDNLVLRAARRLAAVVGTDAGAALVLEKNLPVSSGIGGGSSDAAAALRLLQRLWATRLPPPELLSLASGLGADVPVCLALAPARMSGVGERLHAAPALPEFGLVLVNPLVAVATAAVFRARAGDFSAPAELPTAWPDAGALARDLAGLNNDLEPAACVVCPAIHDVLAALRAAPGCLLARMSGSGATWFGRWESAEAARAAAARVARGDWWAWGGGLFVP